ncbi:sugar-binding protein [Candidatus Omnitrophota bacterium]
MISFMRVFVCFISAFVAAAPTVSAHQGGYTAYAIPLKGITIDGRLDDWPENIPRYPLLNSGEGGSSKYWARGNNTAEFMIGYDGQSNILYIAVRVRDDELVVGDSPSTNDACEIYVDGDNSGERSTNRRLSVDNFSAIQYIMCPPGGTYGPLQNTVSNSSYPVLPYGDITKTRTRAAFSREGETSIYEWAVEVFDHYPDSSTRLTPGKTIGFDVMIPDQDKLSQDYAFLIWTPVKDGQRFFNADLLGDVVLLESDDNMAAVRGCVTDSVNGIPMQGVPVTISDTAGLLYGTVKTDENGTYFMSIPFEGKFAVSATQVRGVDPVQVTLGFGHETTVDFHPECWWDQDIVTFFDMVKSDNRFFRDTMVSVTQFGQLDVDSAVPTVIGYLKDDDPLVQTTAVKILEHIGKNASIVKSHLFDILKDAHISDKLSGPILDVIQRIGLTSRDLPSIIELINNPNFEISFHGYYLSQYLTSESETIIPLLEERFRKTDNPATTRLLSAYVLAKFGITRDTLPFIITMTHEKNRPEKYDDVPLYMFAVYFLGDIGEAAGDAVPRLLEMLDEEHEYPWSRHWIIGMLGRIGPESKAAIPVLRDILLKQEVSAGIRFQAILALGNIGIEAGYVMPDILPMIGSSESRIRKASAEALTLFARSIPSGMDDMSPTEIKRIIPVLEQAQQAILASEYAEADTLAGLNNERIDAINSSVYALGAEYNSRPFVHIRDFAVRHELNRKPWVWAIAGYVLLVAVCLTMWFVLLWRKPFWLYTLNRKLRNPEITPEVIGITFGLRQILWLSWFNYHHRVLDAWVEHNFGKAREAYGNLQTVKERHYYVPLPLNIDDNCVERPEPDIFRKIFERDYFNLIIHGEGGSGKTSLACRLAHWAMGEKVERPLAGHPMLPVMIEHNLTTKLKEQKHPLLQAIHTQVELATEDDDLRPELIQQLLKKRRILVIVDRFSEMNAETREIVLAGHTRDLKINALIITSRLRESPRGSRFTSIEPLRIDKDHLMPFMTAYLIKENLNDSAYFEACTKLSRIAGPRGITALLARLFAEQMRLLNDKATTVDDMPGTIIDLMIGYLNWLNRNRTETDMDNHTLQRISSVIAWKAIEKEYKPSDVSLNTIRNELADEVDLENKLHYLDKKLGVIRYTGESMRRLRISLDPLAEYLAALHLLNLYRDNDVLWSQFVESAQSMSKSGVTIEGFLIAVIDCILAEGEEYGVSEIIFEKLQSLIPREEDELEIAV